MSSFLNSDVERRTRARSGDGGGGGTRRTAVAVEKAIT
jgi:hypothetical protein